MRVFSYGIVNVSHIHLTRALSSSRRISKFDIRYATVSFITREAWNRPGLIVNMLAERIFRETGSLILPCQRPITPDRELLGYLRKFGMSHTRSARYKTTSIKFVWLWVTLFIVHQIEGRYASNGAQWHLRAFGEGKWLQSLSSNGTCQAMRLENISMFCTVVPTCI
jgi:hypothetical protein